MGKQKLTLDYIGRIAKERGCLLISDNYKSIDEKNLEFIFKCGHKAITSWSSFKLSKTGLCKKCTGTQKYTIEEVRNILSNYGCELISCEYKNVRQPLKIVFSCGHIGTRCIADFRKQTPVCKNCARNARISFDEIIKYINSGGFELIGEINYENINTKLNLIDSQGYKYLLNFDQFRKHIIEKTELIKYHQDNPYSILNFRLYLSRNTPLTLDEKEVWINANYKMTYYDQEGYKYYSSPHSIFENMKDGGYGNRFSPYNIYTVENMKKWIKDNQKPFELIEGQVYKKNNQKLKCKCLICPSDEIPFEISWGEILIGNGCGICKGFQVGKYNNLQFKYPDIASEWDHEKNFPITPDKIVPMTHKKYWWICSECGHSYQSISADRCCGGNSCPRCKESKGEKATRKVLDKFNINYTPQFKFPDCCEIKPLPFDFYIHDSNICIEVNGKQHYEIIEFFGGEEGFIERCRRDQIKRDYCKENNINFIEIPYWKFNEIEKFLEQSLNRLQGKEV